LPSISKATAISRGADGCYHITGSAAFAKRKTAVHEVARADVGGVMWQLLTSSNIVVQNRMVARPLRFERARPDFT
jgi:hypothetical protein